MGKKRDLANEHIVDLVSNMIDYMQGYVGNCNCPYKYTERFVTVEEYYSGDVVVDTKTGVEYWMSGGSYNHGTLTVLVDADGKPLICEEYKD